MEPGTPQSSFFDCWQLQDEIRGFVTHDDENVMQRAGLTQRFFVMRFFKKDELIHEKSLFNDRKCWFYLLKWIFIIKNWDGGITASACLMG